MPYILSIDQGTTNTKAVTVNSEGNIVARASQTIAVNYPQHAWVEQDAVDIWESTVQVIESCLRQLKGSPISAIAITNQRESVIIWERETGKPIGPCVTWQCRRSAPRCAELASNNLEDDIHQRTGLQLDPGFSAGKISWLLENTPDGYAKASAGELCAGTVDSWLLWNLTGGHVHGCDVTNASRTQLFNIHTLQWDKALLEYFHVPFAVLPQVFPSSHLYGFTAKPGSTVPAGLPIASMIGDSHAALYGHAGFQPGKIKATYGTGSSLMTIMPKPEISKCGISTTIAWGVGSTTTYALEGNISVTGSAVQWLGELLGKQHMGAAIEELAHSVSDNGGIYFVPAFVGLGAPRWDPDARGLITGLTRGTSAGHLARATLEAIAYQVRDVFDAIQTESVVPLEMLLADGGASANNTLMQFQADILGCPVMRSLSSDVSALGAAHLAGLTTKLWASEDEITKLPRAMDTFNPHFSQEQRESLYSGWQHAVQRTLNHPPMNDD